MIDQSTIARILDAADIVDVVKEFVTLRKAGVNYKGLCPFHDEKTPSFVVSPSKQLCKCFSCGKGGNVVHFIMEHEQMSYPEALRWLAKKYGIEIQERELTDEEKAQATERESLFVLNEWARDYFIDLLHNHVDGVAVGKAYFRQRGFRDDIIRKFQLGYCLPDRDAMARTAIAKGYRPEFLEKTGLCYKTDDGRLLDRYHGRVIFPVHTVSGKVVAFGGRILSSDKKLAKYVNSPESSIYHKSNELYGLYFAKGAIVKHNRCYLVEGYTDVISMHQSGIENVVASSGTSLTAGQIRLIHRFTDNITVLYDGDAAGIKASLRGIDMLLAEGMNISVLLLPDGDDPDSFARKHSAEEYQAYMDSHQVDFIRFKVDLLLRDCAGNPVKRAELIQSVVQSIAVIPRPVVRQMYIQECASMLQVDEALLVSEVSKLIREGRAVPVQQTEGEPKPEPAGGAEQQPAAESGTTTTSAVSPQTATAAQPTQPTEAEQLLISAIIRYGDLLMPGSELPPSDEYPEGLPPLSVAQYVANELEADDLSFHHPICVQILAEAAAMPVNEEGHSLQQFLSHPHAEVSRLAADLGQDRYTLCHSQQTTYVPDRERLYDLIPRLIHDFKNAFLQKELDDLLQQLRDPQVTADTTRTLQIMQRYKELHEVQKAFAQYLGERVVNVTRRRK